MQAVILGPDPLSIADVVAVARQYLPVALSDNNSWKSKLLGSCNYLQEQWQNGKTVYGVTTGYGDSCSRAVPVHLVEQLPSQLVNFHGCGMGQHLSIEATRATMLIRAASFCRGLSGVRPEILEMIASLLNARVTPLIPEEGSVGASGDLTPLSYLAATLMGEREVLLNSTRISAREAFAQVGLEPIALQPKEGLALMNGTSVMTAIACLAFDRADYLARLCAEITSLAVVALQGNPVHFDERLHKAKPHPGQMRFAKWVRESLSSNTSAAKLPVARVQDRYSLRCAPHVAGVLLDILPWMKTVLETELNSANDNPLILAEEREVLHGGHFYGGHVAFVADALKNAVANIADLLDRQVALAMDPATSAHLPANLSGACADTLCINHGFKAVQIACSAWTAEALKNSMPASVFSRSTECHNQDKVSMGTIAARDCMRTLVLTEQVASAALICFSQAIELRIRAGQLNVEMLSERQQKTLACVHRHFEFVDQDRALEPDLRAILDMIHRQEMCFAH